MKVVVYLDGEHNAVEVKNKIRSVFPDASYMIFDAEDENALTIIKKQQTEIDRLESVLLGVMHFVDKWLDGAELEQDEVNRASAMREKTLQIVEHLQAENERLTRKTMEMAITIETCQADAIKEFAEMLKRITLPIELAGGRYRYDVITKQGIDHVLKEMVGED